MSKAILMSIRPEWVYKILNEEKTIEVRKQFPKDYVGWVYIYCTKDNNKVWWYDKDILGCYFKDKLDHETSYECYKQLKPLNGKVVARFWCEKVGIISPIKSKMADTYGHDEKDDPIIYGCLTFAQLDDYLKHKVGYAIHISKLEVFEKPKELSEMVAYNDLLKSIKKPPQSFMFINNEITTIKIEKIGE